MTDATTLAPLRCPRCERTGDPADLTFYRGCPDCAAGGVAVNYVCDVPADDIAAGLAGAGTSGAPGIWRWGSALPVTGSRAVSLREGDTPLVPLPRLGERIGLPRLYAKNESANPTWSHKDRLCALAVAAAGAVGATVVTASSTGNHGAAVAAYAARAGLRSVIFTTTSVPETMKTLMLSYGAELVAVPHPEDRYVLMAEGVDRHGWYPASNGVVPPVGSTPYGVDGYKSIAYELFHELGGALPHTVVLPVAYGDCLAGVSRGFADLRAAGLTDRMPRLVGAELYGALAKGVASGGGVLGPAPMRETAAFSIGGPYATGQAVRAIEASAGEAVSVGEDELLAAQYRLASTEGLFVEAASAVGVAAAEALAVRGAVGADDTVVCLLTSTALKDPAGAAALLPPVALADPATGSPAELVDQITRKGTPR